MRALQVTVFMNTVFMNTVKAWAKKLRIVNLDFVDHFGFAIAAYPIFRIGSKDTRERVASNLRTNRPITDLILAIFRAGFILHG